MREPRVFTVPTGVPFLPTLADALLGRTLIEPWPAGSGLSDCTIFLPTRRAGRALAALLAGRSDGRATLLPRIVPLGDVDDLAADGEDGPGASGLPPALPPVARRLVLTRLVQAWMRRTRGGGEASAAEAVALAGDLEGLMDSFVSDRIDWARIGEAVEAEHSRHFALTLEFVRIAHENWPGILAERDASDPVQRRDAALLAEAARMAAAPPRHPVIAAGSTGSVPATAQLLAAIAGAPTGAVVLPGLDLDLDRESWEAIGGTGEDGPLFGHPQFMMRRLVERHLGTTREAVRPLGSAAPARVARRRLLSEIMRPAETTEAWAALTPMDRHTAAEAGTDGIALVEAADEREEALAIAVALRETLETPGATAAFVTPDRSLARRVAAELARWEIAAEDSAGIALADTRAGRLARLAADAAALRFSAVSVLALLAHPDVTLGLARSEVERRAGILEIAALRGPATRAGLAGLAAGLDARRNARSARGPLPRRLLSDSDWNAASDLVERLRVAFASFGEAGDGAIDLVAVAAAHEEALQALVAPPSGQAPDVRRLSLPAMGAPSHSTAPHHASGAPPNPPLEGEGRPSGEARRTGWGDATAPDETRRHTPDASLTPPRQPGQARWSTLPLQGRVGARPSSRPDAMIPPAGGKGEDGSPRSRRDWSALDRLFDDLAAADGADRVSGRLAEYPAFFATLARMRSLPTEPAGSHRRVKILGLLEARLLDVDRVVLGGLDETVWPPRAESDAFLSRSMRLALGLAPPERRIGQTAHDFVQLVGTPDVVLTRARKRDGKPTVPSRFLERLHAFAGEAPWAAMKNRGARFLHLASLLDAPRAVPPLTRPAPAPGPHRFPRRMSVTEVETLVRDPYSVFARRILRLDPLDTIAVLPSAADRGSLMHDILARFGEQHPAALPADAEARLTQIGLDAFRPYEDAYPDLHALWWPGFQRFVPVFLAWEQERRAGGVAIGVERSGLLEIPVAGGEPVRLTGRADRIETGPDGAAIIDFKTGTPPTDKVVAIGFSPQLTLEAAILMAGGFPEVPASREVPELTYVRIGGRKGLDTREVKPPRGDGRSVGAIVAAHRAGVEALVARYAVEGAGYVSRPYAQYARRFSPYDHLARVKEWSATAGNDETVEP